MKTLPEQVQSYIDWRTTTYGKPFTFADLAAEVARHQRGAGRKCGRQDIENLFKKELSRPRYIVELATAMGTTAEILAKGLYAPGPDSPTNVVSEAEPAVHNVLSLPPSRNQTTDVVIGQFETGGAMGHGLVLQEQPGIIKEWRVSDEWLKLNVPHFTAKKNLAIVTGFGPSMKGMFNPGDPLLVDTGVKVIDHEGVYFFRVGDEGFIKMVQRVPEFAGPGYVLRIISKNPDYPPYDISPSNPHFEVLAKVLTVWRSEQH